MSEIMPVFVTNGDSFSVVKHAVAAAVSSKCFKRLFEKNVTSPALLSARLAGASIMSSPAPFTTSSAPQRSAISCKLCGGDKV